MITSDKMVDEINVQLLKWYEQRMGNERLTKQMELQRNPEGRKESGQREAGYSGRRKKWRKEDSMKNCGKFGKNGGWE